MKRFFAVFIGLVLSITLSAAVSPPAGAQSLNAFTITSYDIRYTLSKDAENRSTLQTKETITADFTSPRTNRGIERIIPHEYKKHPTDLKITSVTDETGASVQYSTSNIGDGTRLRIGDPDVYVQGMKTYVITYTQRDVTHYFDNTQRTEWYWDTNGTSWRVPIDALTVSVTLDPSIRADLQGAPRCYQGQTGSTTPCYWVGEADAYKTSVQNLRPGQNVTIAFGFNQDAFVGYQKSAWEVFLGIWLVVTGITIPLSVLFIVILSVSYTRRRNRTGELKVTPVEYIPPRGTSVITSGQILVGTGSVFGAQLIDLAVRHYVEIIETKEKSFWVPAEYTIHVVRDVNELLAEEKEILTDMFGHTPAVGEQLAMKELRTDYAYRARTLDNDKKLTGLIEGEYALRAKDATHSGYFKRWSGALLVLGLVTLSIPLLATAGIAAIMAATLKPLTDKGLELRRYLLGLNRYIKAAETERLKMLQGPDTAEKVGRPINANDARQLVKLYERVLPYAILYGHEKEWSKRLGVFYEQTNGAPDWYSGQSTFNAVAFSSAVTGFSHAASSSSGVSTSSGSGGSSGGGSSGGGGGGGGGGGW